MKGASVLSGIPGPHASTASTEAALRSALAAVQPAGAPAGGEQAVPSGTLSVPRVSMEG